MTSQTSTSMTTDEVRALEQAVGDVLADHCTPERLAAAEGRVDRALWDVLAGSGLTRVGIDESAGGSGGGLTEAVAVLRLVGEHAAPVPLAEATLLAGWLLDGSIKAEETIVDGLERAPDALNMLFEGANVGKLLVRVA